MRVRICLCLIFFFNTYPINAMAAVEEVLDINQTLSSTGSGTVVDAIGKFTRLYAEFYFIADDGIHGSELWKSDGTPSGTELVKDINPGMASSFPLNLTNINGVLYFSADDGVHGSELWKSDGTAPGTVMIADISPLSSSNPSQFYALKGEIFFSATSENSITPLNYGVTEIWKTDGTQQNTEKFSSGFFAVEGDVGEMAGDDQQLFFTTNSSLWVSDGSKNNIINLASGSLSYDPFNLKILDGRAYFHAIKYGLPGLIFTEFWQSDGTIAGTTKLNTVSPFIPVPLPQGERQIVKFDNEIYYVIKSDQDHLYKLDVTGDSTLITSDNTICCEFAVVNDSLYFAKANQLWKISNTDSNPTLVKKIGNRSMAISQLTRLNNTLYFVAGDTVNGIELWQSDGTPKGTMVVSNSVAGPQGSQPEHLHAFSGHLYFATTAELANGSLWRTTDSKLNPPVVITQIQTMNNEPLHHSGTPSVPWITVATRDINHNSASISLERAEVAHGNVEFSEQIAYLAIDANQSGEFHDDSDNTIRFETQLTENKFIGHFNNCVQQRFSIEYQSNPIVVASLSSRAGGNGGWLRRCLLNEQGVGLYVEEDQYTDKERSHIAEAASLLIFNRPFTREFVHSSENWQLETGEIEVRQNNISGEFSQITYQNGFNQTPLVFVFPGAAGGQPASVRIRNITTAGFEIDVVEPMNNDGLHRAQTVHYVALTPGIHYLPSGEKISAQSILTSASVFGQGVSGVKRWQSISFP